MKVLISFLALVALATAAFNVDEFNRNYCKTSANGRETNCTSFYLGHVDDAAFQNENFVISRATKVILSGCTLSNLNENFINKFPNAVNMTFHQCSLDLKKVHSNLSRENRVLKQLTIEYSNLYDVANATAFDYLTGLSDFRLNGYYLASNYIGDSWFRNNRNLSKVEITQLSLTGIDAKTFVNLRQLASVNISVSGLKSLSLDLFRNNTNLESFVFNNNAAQFVPLPTLPKSIKNVSVNYTKVGNF